MIKRLILIGLLSLALSDVVKLKLGTIEESISFTQTCQSYKLPTNYKAVIFTIGKMVNVSKVFISEKPLEDCSGKCSSKASVCLCSFIISF